MKDITPDFKELERIVDEDGSIHHDKLDALGYDIFKAKWIYDKENPSPNVCVYCNAPWSPKMLEFYETSGYCDTCWSSDKVLDIFCSNCDRLVYRKEI